MSLDRPQLSSLLSSVRELLDSLSPMLPTERRYDVRVGVYLLEMAEREVELGRELAMKDRARLSTLLGEDLPLLELEALFAKRLREGAFDARLDDALKEALALVVHKVRVVRPTHLEPRDR